LIVVKHFDIRIYGRVQGVGFRYAARNKARELGISGWIENERDGSVHAEIHGSVAACHSFLRWCGEGTGYSWVEKVEVDELEESQEGQTGRYPGFIIRS
jgi:acylphosphatase